MNNKKNSLFFFLFIFVLPQLDSYSQAGKENTALFILQGTAKLKGRSIDGVSLELTKDGKQKAKIITSKNGLYSFEMNKSNADTKSEYFLKIFKEGIVKGSLSINTYIPPEKYDITPYVFSLDFNLTAPAVTGAAEKRGFGKIKWDTQLGVFAYDKDYVNKTEKDTAKSTKDFQSEIMTLLKSMTDSSKHLIAEIEKKKKEEENPKEKTAKKNNVAAEKNSPLLTDKTAKSNAAKLNEKDDSKTLLSQVSEKDTKQKDAGKQKKNDSQVSKSVFDYLAQPDRKKRANDSLAVIHAKQNEKSGSKETDEQLKKTTAVKSDEEKKKKDEQAIRLKSELKSTGLKEKEKAKPSPEIASANSLEKIMKNKNRIDSIILNTKQASEFNLTGIPLEQFKKRLSSSNADQHTFDGAAVFSENNEKNEILEAKEKAAKKKSANLAKKYETSNTLTRLLDAVEEFDKK